MHVAIRNFTLIAAAAALVAASATPAVAGTGTRGSDPLACLTNSSAWCLHPYGGSAAGDAEIDIYNRNDSTNGDSWTFDQVGTFTNGADAPRVRDTRRRHGRMHRAQLTFQHLRGRYPGKLRHERYSMGMVLRYRWVFFV